MQFLLVLMSNSNPFIEIPHPNEVSNIIQPRLIKT